MCETVHTAVAVVIVVCDRWPVDKQTHDAIPGTSFYFLVTRVQWANKKTKKKIIKKNCGQTPVSVEIPLFYPKSIDPSLQQMKHIE